ncbi:hypothetical protein MU582_06075 [Nocardioidaceae bacterium SCSIO 66511]|nr:hypothetical protein MU582_06075 [Nocardioidaceae bacterium SCSIO 66511]
MRAARTIAAIAAVCVVAACSSSGDDDASPDDEASTHSTTTDSSPSATDEDDGTADQGDGATDDDGDRDEGDSDDSTDGSDDGDDGDTTDEGDDATDDSVNEESVSLNWTMRRLDDAGQAAATRAWTGVADTLGKQVTISGPGRTLRFRAARGRVQGLEMQWPWAVVYAGADMTRGAKRGELAVYDLRSGNRRMVGKVGSAPPPSASGSISMDDGRLAYPTGPNNRYCLAQLDLKSLNGKRLTCAKPLKEGFTQFRLTPAALGYTSFDSKAKPCLTLKRLDDGETDVVEAADRCVGWEVVPGEDSDVWLQVENRHRVEVGTAYARDGDGDAVKLGPAMSGSTTWCGGSTYYVRPAGKDGRADDLMRWSPESGLQRVWTPQGRKVSFVFAPHCGGSTITLPALDRKQNGIVLTAPAA